LPVVHVPDRPQLQCGFFRSNFCFDIPNLLLNLCFCSPRRFPCEVISSEIDCGAAS